MKKELTKFYQMGFYLLIIAFCVVSVLVFVNKSKADEYIDLDQIQSSQGLDILPLECGIERETPLDTFMGQDNVAYGLTIYRYDTNKDGLNDVQVAIPTGDPNRYPLFYTFDRTYNNEPDITYVDQRRDGTCAGIQVYWTKQGGFLQPDVLPDYRKGA